MALVNRVTNRDQKLDKMMRDRQVDVDTRLRLAAAESKNARLNVQIRATSQVAAALNVLESMMLDPETPAVTRRLCALDMLALANANPANANDSAALEKPLHEMTADDLRGILDRQRKAVEVLESSLQGDVIEVISAPVGDSLVIEQPESLDTTSGASASRSYSPFIKLPTGHQDVPPMPEPIDMDAPEQPGNLAKIDKLQAKAKAAGKPRGRPPKAKQAEAPKRRGRPPKPKA